MINIKESTSDLSTKIDYISGTEDAYVKEDARIKVQVSGPVYGDRSIGVLVDLHFEENGIVISAGRLEWFPKSLCAVEKVNPIDDTKFLPTYFLYAPEWLLIKNKVKYTKP